MSSSKSSTAQRETEMGQTLVGFVWLDGSVCSLKYIQQRNVGFSFGPLNDGKVGRWEGGKVGRWEGGKVGRPSREGRNNPPIPEEPRKRKTRGCSSSYQPFSFLLMAGSTTATTTTTTTTTGTQQAHVESFAHGDIVCVFFVFFISSKTNSP